MLKTIAILATFASLVTARVDIDVQEDIPVEGDWTVDCSTGYKNLPSEFNCHFGESVNFPPEDLNGEVGFWTKCGTRCEISYNVQPDDVQLVVRAYQKNVHMEVLFNGGTRSEFASGDGWLEYIKNLQQEAITQVTLRLEFIAGDYFTLLDKVSILGSADPTNPPTTTEQRTTPEETTTEDTTPEVTPPTDQPILEQQMRIKPHPRFLHN